jgi:hypothetical protein
MLTESAEHLSLRHNGGQNTVRGYKQGMSPTGFLETLYQNGIGGFKKKENGGSSSGFTQAIEGRKEVIDMPAPHITDQTEWRSSHRSGFITSVDPVSPIMLINNQRKEAWRQIIYYAPPHILKVAGGKLLSRATHS